MRESSYSEWHPFGEEKSADDEERKEEEEMGGKEKANWASSMVRRPNPTQMQQPFGALS
jgi:hypothetical protein